MQQPQSANYTVTYTSRKAFQEDQRRLKAQGWVVELALDQAWNSMGQLTSIRVTYQRENAPPQSSLPKRPSLRYPTGSVPESRQPFPPPPQSQKLVKVYQNANDFQRDRQHLERQGWTVVDGDAVRDATGNFTKLSAGFTITYQRASAARSATPPPALPFSKSPPTKVGKPQQSTARQQPKPHPEWEILIEDEAFSLSNDHVTGFLSSNEKIQPSESLQRRLTQLPRPLQKTTRIYNNASDFQHDRQVMERQGWTVVDSVPETGKLDSVNVIYQRNAPLMPSASPLRYGGLTLAILVIAYGMAIGFAFLEMIVQNAVIFSANTSSTYTPGILLTLSFLLILAISGFIILLDKHNFFTLFGRVDGKHTNFLLGMLAFFGYCCLFIMPPIYFLVAVRVFISARHQTFGQLMREDWCRFRTQLWFVQIGIVVSILLLISAFTAFTWYAASVDSASALHYISHS
jgi:hypothetical protein